MWGVHHPPHSLAWCSASLFGILIWYVKLLQFPAGCTNRFFGFRLDLAYHTQCSWCGTDRTTVERIHRSIEHGFVVEEVCCSMTPNVVSIIRKRYFIKTKAIIYSKKNQGKQLFTSGHCQLPSKSSSVTILHRSIVLNSIEAQCTFGVFEQVSCC